MAAPAEVATLLGHGSKSASPGGSTGGADDMMMLPQLTGMSRLQSRETIMCFVCFQRGTLEKRG